MSRMDDGLAVLDWRRQGHDLYADVRGASTPARGHDLWRRGRDRLLGAHPASPIPVDERGTAVHLPVPAYDPAWRFEAAVERAEPAHLEALQRHMDVAVAIQHSRPDDAHAAMEAIMDRAIAEMRELSRPPEERS